MNTRRPTLILSFTLLVVMPGYGMVLPVIPFYIERLGAGGRELSADSLALLCRSARGRRRSSCARDRTREGE
jgi:hypothetical protein